MATTTPAAAVATPSSAATGMAHAPPPVDLNATNMSTATAAAGDGGGGGDLGATVPSHGVDVVPREDELLHWLNTFLRSRYRQIEDLRDSVAFAQIMDAAVPDAIPLDLFDYNAATYESYYRNASLLRAALDTVDLSSAGIDPDKIAVGQLEANFSLLYFCYTFITTENPAAVREYDAVGRREAALESQGLSKMNKFLLRTQPDKRQPVVAAAAAVASGAGLKGAGVGEGDSLELPPAARASGQMGLPAGRASPPPRSGGGSSGTAAAAAAAAATTGGAASPAENGRVEELRYLVASLETEMTSRVMALNVLTENVRAVRAERDHYFDKLHAVEKACGLFRAGPHAADAERLLCLMRRDDDADFALPTAAEVGRTP